MIVPLTVEYLHEVLNYDPLTGVFTWRVSRGQAKVGKIAGCVFSKGYREIMLDRVGYLAHRLAWLYVNKNFPLQQIDHINGKKDDNRLINLRLCSNSLNQQNLCLTGRGSTGYLGVTFNKRAKKYVAQITIKGFYKCLGLFDTALEASQAYVIAKKTIHTFQGWAE